MLSSDEHMIGFEKEDQLYRIFAHELIRNRFNKWKDFIEVAKIINPALCDGAFEAKPCRRKLRYIGYDNFKDSNPIGNNQEVTDDFFVYGNEYYSTTFNGGTYSIEGRERRIGSVYFEFVQNL